MNDIPQVHSGKTVQTAEFSQNYLEPLISGKEGNLVVFVQEKVNMNKYISLMKNKKPNSQQINCII